MKSPLQSVLSVVTKVAANMGAEDVLAIALGPRDAFGGFDVAHVIAGDRDKLLVALVEFITRTLDYRESADLLDRLAARMPPPGGGMVN